MFIQDAGWNMHVSLRRSECEGYGRWHVRGLQLNTPMKIKINTVILLGAIVLACRPAFCQPSSLVVNNVAEKQRLESIKRESLELYRFEVELGNIQKKVISTLARYAQNRLTHAQAKQALVRLNKESSAIRNSPEYQAEVVLSFVPSHRKAAPASLAPQTLVQDASEAQPEVALTNRQDATPSGGGRSLPAIRITRAETRGTSD